VRSVYGFGWCSAAPVRAGAERAAAPSAYRILHHLYNTRPNRPSDQPNRTQPPPLLPKRRANKPQAITSCIDDVLADAVLHGHIPKGSLAWMDLDPSTRAPRCWAGRPAAANLVPHITRASPGELIPGEDDSLVTQLRVGAGGFMGGGFDGGDGGGEDVAASAEVYVLASGGVEDEE